MDQQNPTLAKIPILDTGKFKQWQFRIQQYLQHEHYALWEVIEFRDSYEAPKEDAATATVSDGFVKKKGRTVAVTTEDMQKRKNDVKARTTLLLSLLDEHQLRFSKYKTAQELWAAILKTFGGNEATKKTKKNLLKQQSDLDTMSLDDLYNHLKDINQIDEDDMEEMDIKWNMALLSMRADRFRKKTGKKITIQGTNVAGFDKSKAECFNYHKMGHFARECRALMSQDRRRKYNYRQGSKKEEHTPKALMAINEVGWDWSYMANEDENHTLVAEEKAPTEFALMAKTSVESEVFDNSVCHRIESLTNELELLKKEKGKLDSKLTSFQSASKDLDSLLESQRLDKNKEGLGYSIVPPPAQVYSPPKKDLSWTCLPEFADDTVIDYSRPTPAIESTSDDVQNRNTSVTKTEASPSTISPKPFIKFVKETDRSTETETAKVETAKPAVKYAAMVEKGTSRPQNNTHKSFTSRTVAHKPYRPPMRPVRPNMNVAQPKRTFFHKLAHSYSKKPFQRTSAVRSQSRAPSVSTVNRKFSTINRNFLTVNRKFPTANRKFPTGSTKFSTADMRKKGNAVKASAATPRIILMTKAIGIVVALGT
nr:hypothetical protein [Tanacetum cinerariifolium]